MPPFQLCGPTGPNQSLTADAQRTIGWYQELIDATKKWALQPCPGKKVFATSAGMKAVRETLEISGRGFVVMEDLSKQVLMEVMSDKSLVTIGTLGAAGGNVTMAVNNAAPQQLLIASAGRLFLATLSTPIVLTEIDTTTQAQLQGPVADVNFLGPYFLARLKNSQRFQISGLLNGAAWNPLDIAQVQLFPDLLRAAFEEHETYWLASGTKMIGYSNTGNADFPFEPYVSGVVNQGIAGEKAFCKQDNTTFLLTDDKNGARFLGRLRGFVLQRVSKHSVENEWRKLTTVADVELFAYSEGGHPFVQMFFPSARSESGVLGRTWVYDIASDEIHERQQFNGGADRARCHMQLFGKHLVGDPYSGTLYEQSIDFVDDAGALIRRIRRAPLPMQENQYLDIGTVEILAEMGQGPIADLKDGQGLPRGPQMGMRISRNYGHTWGTQLFQNAGKIGDFLRRLRWTRNGRARGGYVEIEVTDPVYWRILDGFFQA